MIALAQDRPADRPAGQTKFLAMLPVITRYASLAFRTLDVEAREEAMAEVMANAYVAFARLAELGKVELAYPTVLAVYGIRQYWDGRRVGTKANSKDAYAQCRNDRRREYLGTPGDQRWRESLIDSRFGVDRPDDLSIGDASEFIDLIKSQSNGNGGRR